MTLLPVYLFVIGAVFGSFINVVADRLPRNENIFLGHSHCDHCKKKIAYHDLIPVVSYLILGGRCRYCKKKIPLRVFLVEAGSGLFFVLLFLLAFTNWIVYALYCAVFLILLAITIIDINHGVIPDVLLIILGLVSIFVLFRGSAPIFAHLATAFSSFAFFLLIFLITRGRGIGFGDVKYALVIGLLLTPAGLIIALYTAFLTGAAISIILIIAGKKKLKGGSIPFGPFISLGVIVSLLFENQILQVIMPFLRM